MMSKNILKVVMVLSIVTNQMQAASAAVMTRPPAAPFGRGSIPLPVFNLDEVIDVVGALRNPGAGTLSEIIDLVEFVQSVGVPKAKEYMEKLLFSGNLLTEENKKDLEKIMEEDSVPEADIQSFLNRFNAQQGDDNKIYFMMNELEIPIQKITELLTNYTPEQKKQIVLNVEWFFKKSLINAVLLKGKPLNDKSLDSKDDKFSQNVAMNEDIETILVKQKKRQQEKQENSKISLMTKERVLELLEEVEKIPNVSDQLEYLYKELDIQTSSKLSELKQQENVRDSDEQEMVRHFKETQIVRDISDNLLKRLRFLDQQEQQ